MQLRQAEILGTIDDECVRVRDVETGLDDGGTHQHVELTVPETGDGAFELILVHLTVCHSNSRLGDHRCDIAGSLVDGRHPIVNVENLAVAQQFSANRCRHLLG